MRVFPTREENRKGEKGIKKYEYRQERKIDLVKGVLAPSAPVCSKPYEPAYGPAVGGVERARLEFE